MHLVDGQAPDAGHLLMLDHTTTETAHTCAYCGTAFRARVAAAHYATDGLTPGERLPAPDHICPTCLTATSTQIAQVVAALDIIAAAGLNDHALGLVQQTISTIRRSVHDQANAEIIRELYGPGRTEPVVVDLGHEPICDGSDLRAAAYLVGGNPRIELVDAGGWQHADLDLDAAREMVQQISDLITTAETAARF